MARSTSKLLNEAEVVENKELETPAVVEEPKVEEPVVDDEIQDIKIEGATRKKFRINGDNNRILELNTNDIGVSYRLTEAYDRLNKLMDEVQGALADLPDSDEVNDEQYRTITDNLKTLNENMCKEIDFIFDAPVSKICSDGGSMYDPSNGMFRYEHIIDAVTSLYESSLNKEFTLMRKRVGNRTAQYTGKTPKKATKKYNH